MQGLRDPFCIGPCPDLRTMPEETASLLQSYNPYGLYEGITREAINQFKFYGLRRLSKPLGKLLLGFDLPAVDGVVPVPLTIGRLRERGFNHPQTDTFSRK